MKVCTQDGFEIHFYPEEEFMSKREHFIGECGWSEEDYKKLKGTKWFCAKVSAVKGGVELASEYLGGCCYDSYKDFYGREGCYFDQMKNDCITAAKLELNKVIKGKMQELIELMNDCP